MTDTLAYWIREVVQAAGINIKVFGAHSVGEASSSFALDQHASIDSVLQTGTGHVYKLLINTIIGLINPFLPRH